MDTRKTNEEIIIEKHQANIRAGIHNGAQVIEGAPPAMGDYRWTEDLILATWYQGEHGRPPENGLEYRVGRSGGGFDVLDFNFLPKKFNS